MVLLHHVSREAAGEILVVDRFDGTRISEGSLRQCVHCQYTWRHRPGSGKLRGYCQNCHGHLCGKRGCMTYCYHKEQQIEDIEAIYLGNKRAIEAAVRRQLAREAMFG